MPTFLTDGDVRVLGGRANNNLHVRVTEYTQDVGVTGSLANALSFYAAGDTAAWERAAGLLDALWEDSDGRGISVPETRRDDNRCDDQMYIPNGWQGAKPNGDTIEPGSTFESIRIFYRNDPDWPQAHAYLNGGPAPSLTTTASGPRPTSPSPSRPARNSSRRRSCDRRSKAPAAWQTGAPGRFRLGAPPWATAHPRYGVRHPTHGPWQNGENMDYCTTCRRYLNGALLCPGCEGLTDHATKHQDETDGTAPLPELWVPQNPVGVHREPRADVRADARPGDETRGDEANVEADDEAAETPASASGGRRAAHRAVRRNGRRRYALASVLGVAVLGLTVAEVGDVGLPPVPNPVGSGRESEAADTPTIPEATAEASGSADAPVEQVTGSASTNPEESPSDDGSTDGSTEEPTEEPSEGAPEETTPPPVDDEGAVETSPAPTTSSPDPETSGPTDPGPDSPSPTEPAEPEPEPEEPVPSPTGDDCWWFFC